MTLHRWKKKPVYNREGHQVGENQYAITDGEYTICKAFALGKWVYSISRGGKFIGGHHDSAKKALQSLAGSD